MKFYWLIHATVKCERSYLHMQQVWYTIAVGSGSTRQHWQLNYRGNNYQTWIYIYMSK